MIDEKARRLPGFNEDESVPVAFGDGQEWYLPRPTVDVFASFATTPPTEVTSSSFGADFDAMVKAVSASDDGFFPAVAALAADLLRRNYDLSDAELSGLLRYKRGDKESSDWIGEVLAVANGNGAPKA